MLEVNFRSAVLNNMAETLKTVNFNLSALKIKKYYQGERAFVVVSYNELPERLLAAHKNNLLSEEDLNKTLNYFWTNGFCEREGTVYELL